MTELILGTAQFGSAYGVTNSLGRLDDAAVGAILTEAREGGIRTFDTAADYGDSQERLGRLAPPGNRYITKFSLPAGPEPTEDNIYRESMAALHVDHLAGLMLHRVADLTDPRFSAALDVLLSARSLGHVARIGVSIYDEDDLELALDRFPELDILQFPGNIVDRRLLDHPVLARLHAEGVELHVRSAFLQGILLADADTLGTFFEPIRRLVDRLALSATRAGITRAGLALAFLRDHPVVDAVVVGATTAGELAAILSGWQEDAEGAVEFIEIVSRELVDPRRWPRVGLKAMPR